MNKVLFIGNGINNIGDGSINWGTLLEKIKNIYNININMSNEKHFPLLYEEIYLSALKENQIKIDEDEIKLKIAEIIRQIEPNEIHEELIKMDVKDYITTNYDYTLQKCLLANNSEEKTKDLKNEGLIRETKYSVFRHNEVNEKRFWHAHGEINVPSSITLGFEHYGGQIQKFRDYTVSGTNYKSSKINRSSLHRRLIKNLVNYDSWIDFFFKDEIHILGLALDYVETDLWWLLTNRARFQLEKQSNKNGIFPNKIFYYCPKKYEDKDKTKIMEANQIRVKNIDLEGKEFYKEVINMIKKS